MMSFLILLTSLTCTPEANYIEVQNNSTHNLVEALNKNTESTQLLINVLQDNREIKGEKEYDREHDVEHTSMIIGTII